MTHAIQCEIGHGRLDEQFCVANLSLSCAPSRSHCAGHVRQEPQAQAIAAAAAAGLADCQPDCEQLGERGPCLLSAGDPM